VPSKENSSLCTAAYFISATCWRGDISPFFRITNRSPALYTRSRTCARTDSGGNSLLSPNLCPKFCT
jgi:hypothetical protein